LFGTNSIAHFKKIFNDFCVKKEKLGNFAEWENILLPYFMPSLGGKVPSVSEADEGRSPFLVF